MREILDVEPILAEARAVGGVGEQIGVVADLEAAERQELDPLGELVQVEQHFFGALPPNEPFGGRFLAAPDWVLLPFLDARIVKVLAAPNGHAQSVCLMWPSISR